MKRLPSRMLLVLLVSSCLAMAACSTSTGGTSTSGGSTPSPTATAAPTKPTSVPTLIVGNLGAGAPVEEVSRVLAHAGGVAAVTPEIFIGAEGAGNPV
jgi:hypothetical protein